MKATSVGCGSVGTCNDMFRECTHLVLTQCFSCDGGLVIII